MNKTKRFNTPGGSPDSLENPPFSEVGSTDSGESQLLQKLINPFSKSKRVTRSPPSASSITGQRSPPVAPISVEKDSEKTKTLEKDNNELRQRLDEIAKLYQELKKEVDLLRKENEALKNNQAQRNLNADACRYETDEEELERETEGSTKKRPSKKRKAGSSPEAASSSEKRDVPTTQAQIREKPLKDRAPPPINVVGIAEFKKLQVILKSLLPSAFKVVSLNSNKWKVCVQDPESYRLLSRKLNEDKIEWYTYENKSERPLRVVARGLHASCPREEIISDLKQHNFKIVDAMNILKREKQQKDGEPIVTKRGLPLFILTFDKSEKLDDIYKIKTILNIVVKIEPLRKNTRLVPQCKRCQGFNHTQTYCRKEPRCVKCAGKHLTTDCNGSTKSPAMCTNCNGNHPASYRGCEVARELQKRRSETVQFRRKPEPKEKNISESPKKKKALKATTRKEKQSRPTPPTPQAPPVHRQRKNSTKTYAQIAAKEKTPSKNGSTKGPASEIFEIILSKLEEQCETNKLIFERLLVLENCLRPKQSKTKS